MAKAIARTDMGPRLERMLQIHQAIGSGRRPNCPKLEEMLGGVSRWTVMRDIEYMRDRLGLPIESEIGKTGGYYYSSEVTHFPLLQISEGELVALSVARQALEAYRGTSVERGLRSAFEKLTSGLRDTVEFNFAELSAVISFRASGFSPVVDLEAFDLVSRACIRREAIRVVYKKASGEARERVLYPHHLVSAEGAWYVLATGPGNAEIRTFAVSRMSALRLAGENFTPIEGFDPTAYLATGFGIFGGGEPEKIELRFVAEAAEWIAERQWHPSQILRRRKTGELDLELLVTVAPDLERWILGWGDRVEVLRPKKLRVRIAEVGKRIGDRNAS